MSDLQEFTAACFDALQFTDCGPDDECHGAELSDETRLDLEADCRSFWRRFAPYFYACEGNTMRQAGHDFWLTRNEHGAGFWDGDWPETYSDMFTKLAQAYGPFETYLGDDGKIYA